MAAKNTPAATEITTYYFLSAEIEMTTKLDKLKILNDYELK